MLSKIFNFVMWVSLLGCFLIVVVCFCNRKKLKFERETNQEVKCLINHLD
jgi:hypothetical protein